jgi:hypothetical protein
MTEIAVISTAFGPPHEITQRCLESVQAQKHADWIRHFYIDAQQYGGACLENVSLVIDALDPATVVLWVDGDDWLAHDQVVERVLREYDKGAWMTWGQYAHWDVDTIHPGHCHDSKHRRACRIEPWYASHLRTFRAGLFQQIDKEDFAFEGEKWSPQCCDLATMFPMLEMADDRGAFIPDVLYVYNYTQRRERKHDFSGPLCDAQERAVHHFRSMPRYPRLEKAPW